MAKVIELKKTKEYQAMKISEWLTANWKWIALGVGAYLLYCLLTGKFTKYKTSTVVTGTPAVVPPAG